MAAEVRKADMDGDPRPFSASLVEAAAGGGRGGVVLERLRESVIETQHHISLHKSHRLCVL